MSKKIILLAGDGKSTKIVYHFLNAHFNVVGVFIEKSETKKKFLKRRVKKLGYIKVFGQLLFMTIIVPILQKIASKRYAEIIKKHNLNVDDIPSDIITKIKSVNNSEVQELLTRLKPDVIVVNGTRIIGKKLLRSLKVKFINMHAGITPLYRGVHGGYWALSKNDRKHCGVTLHLVDEGIDTGNIIYQILINVKSNDNFITYPLLQVAEGLKLLKMTIDDILNSDLKIKPTPSGESKLWYHPTLFEYLKNLIFKGVK